MYRTVRGRSDRGVALMIALGILAIMAMLGGAFVKFMRVEEQAADYELDRLQARYFARAGIEAARVHVGTATTAGGIAGKLGEKGTYEVSIEKVGDVFDVDSSGNFTRTDGSRVTARIFARMRPAADGVRIGMWQE